MTKKKAILLSRVSTLGQDLQQQTNVLIEESKKLGYDNNIVIIENKESGITLDEEDRQGLIKLKELISTNEYDCVICYEISRIARKPSILYNIRDLLVKNKIQLIIIKPYLKLLEDDYTISHTTNLLFSLYSSFSENEMIIKKERMLRGKQHKRNLNLYTGGRILYGYKVNDKQKIVINEKESNTVKLIFNMYNDNNSISTIYQELYDLNITEKTYTNGIVWVYNILKNSSYCGEENNNKYKYEPIISKNLFNETQKKLQSNKRDIKSKSKISNKKLLLLGLLYYRLNNENKRMYSHTRSNTNFYTTTIENNNKKTSKFIDGEILDNIIWDVVKNYKMLHFNDNNKILLKEYKEADKNLTNKINTYKHKRTDIQNSIDKLEERLILGKISEDKVEQLEQRLYDELNETKQKIDNWQYELETIQSKITNLTTENDIPQITDFNLLTFDEKQLLIKEVIKKIIIMDEYNSSNKKRYTHEIDILYNTGHIKTLIFASNNYIKKGYILDSEQYLI